MSLEYDIRKLQKTEVGRIIKKRLESFRAYQKKPGRQWFSELCFCILTANSRADSAIKIQDELGALGFCNCIADDIRECIKKHKHRFHNNKTGFIIDAREHPDIKKTVTGIADEMGESAARDWLSVNIKGLGYKEASHFMRNVGYNDLAILDRHIINLMVSYGLIKEKPKNLSSKKTYHKIEKTFKRLAEKLGMSAAELDLYMWYMKTGKVLK